MALRRVRKCGLGRSLALPGWRVSFTHAACEERACENLLADFPSETPAGLLISLAALAMLNFQSAHEQAPGIMKATRIKDGRSGLTAIEVLVILAVIAVLIALILPMLAKPKSTPGIIRCRNNLKSVGLALRIWANDNGDCYPMQVPDAQGGAAESVDAGSIVRIFQVMSNELSVPKSVVCPAEWSLAATNWTTLQSSNISYFIGVDAVDVRPNMILSGDRDIAENGQLLRGTVNLTANRPVAWHKMLHQEGGNLLFADGSVQLAATLKLPGALPLRQQLANTGDPTNRVLFPQ